MSLENINASVLAFCLQNINTSFSMRFDSNNNLLHQAIVEKRDDLITPLLEDKYKALLTTWLNEENAEQKTPLDLIMNSDHYKLELNRDHLEIKSQDETVLTVPLAEEKFGNGNNLLHAAVLYNRTDIIKQLEDDFYSTNPNYRATINKWLFQENNDGETPTRLGELKDEKKWSLLFSGIINKIADNVDEPGAVEVKQNILKKEDYDLAEALGTLRNELSQKIQENRTPPQSQSELDYVYWLEDGFTFYQLEQILKNFESKDKKIVTDELREFLKQRWDRIKDTNLAYTENSASEANRICVQLARILQDSLFNAEVLDKIMVAEEISKSNWDIRYLKDVINPKIKSCSKILEQRDLSDEKRRQINQDLAIAKNCYEKGRIAYRAELENTKWSEQEIEELSSIEEQETEKNRFQFLMPTVDGAKKNMIDWKRQSAFLCESYLTLGHLSVSDDGRSLINILHTLDPYSVEGLEHTLRNQYPDDNWNCDLTVGEKYRILNRFKDGDENICMQYYQTIKEVSSYKSGQRANGINLDELVEVDVNDNEIRERTKIEDYSFKNNYSYEDQEKIKKAIRDILSEKLAPTQQRINEQLEKASAQYLIALRGPMLKFVVDYLERSSKSKSKGNALGSEYEATVHADFGGLVFSRYLELLRAKANDVYDAFLQLRSERGTVALGEHILHMIFRSHGGEGIRVEHCTNSSSGLVKNIYEHNSGAYYDEEEWVKLDSKCTQIKEEKLQPLINNFETSGVKTEVYGEEGDAQLITKIKQIAAENDLFRAFLFAGAAEQFGSAPKWVLTDNAAFQAYKRQKELEPKPKKAPLREERINGIPEESVGASSPSLTIKRQNSFFADTEEIANQRNTLEIWATKYNNQLLAIQKIADDNGDVSYELIYPLGDLSFRDVSELYFATIDPKDKRSDLTNIIVKLDSNKFEEIFINLKFQIQLIPNHVPGTIKDFNEKIQQAKEGNEGFQKVTDSSNQEYVTRQQYHSSQDLQYKYQNLFPPLLTLLNEINESEGPQAGGQ